MLIVGKVSYSKYPPRTVFCGLKIFFDPADEKLSNELKYAYGTIVNNRNDADFVVVQDGNSVNHNDGKNVGKEWLKVCLVEKNIVDRANFKSLKRSGSTQVYNSLSYSRSKNDCLNDHRFFISLKGKDYERAKKLITSMSGTVVEAKDESDVVVSKTYKSKIRHVNIVTAYWLNICKKDGYVDPDWFPLVFRPLPYQYYFLYY